MLLVNLFLEFKFDGFSTDTCRSLVALKDVRILIVKSSYCCTILMRAVMILRLRIMGKIIRNVLCCIVYHNCAVISTTI